MAEPLLAAARRAWTQLCEEQEEEEEEEGRQHTCNILQVCSASNKGRHCQGLATHKCPAVLATAPRCLWHYI